MEADDDLSVLLAHLLGPEARGALGRLPRLDPADVGRLAVGDDPLRAVSALSHPLCPDGALGAGACHHDARRRRAVASNPAAPVPLVAALTGDADQAVAAAAAANPALGRAAGEHPAGAASAASGRLAPIAPLRRPRRPANLRRRRSA